MLNNLFASYIVVLYLKTLIDAFANAAITFYNVTDLPFNTAKDLVFNFATGVFFNTKTGLFVNNASN